MCGVILQLLITLRAAKVQKRFIAIVVAAQFFIVLFIHFSFPFLARTVFSYSSPVPSQFSMRHFDSYNTNHIRPTILVGVFITNRTASSRLMAFRKSFENSRPLMHCNAHLVFVLGNSRYLDEDHADILRLQIHENMDEGKTFQYFSSAIDWFLSHNVSYHPLNGIVKMDTDTAVDWPAFSKFVTTRLKPMYYAGRLNNRLICGNLDHCPPYGCQDFSDGCWVYMSGGWYALSLDLAIATVLNCAYSASHTVGYEDLTVGNWIAHCATDVSVVHVENGDFFCHSSQVLDDNILQMRFPGHYLSFFNEVRCSNVDGKVK
jgi:hypothetical protein